MLALSSSRTSHLAALHIQHMQQHALRAYSVKSKKMMGCMALFICFFALLLLATTTSD